MSHPSRPFAALAAALLTAALPTAALPAQDPAPPAVEALLDRVEAVLGPPRALRRAPWLR